MRRTPQIQFNIVHESTEKPKKRILLLSEQEIILKKRNGDIILRCGSNDLHGVHKLPPSNSSPEGGAFTVDVVTRHAFDAGDSHTATRILHAFRDLHLTPGAGGPSVSFQKVIDQHTSRLKAQLANQRGILDDWGNACMDDFILHERLGQGSFGRVVKCVYRETKKVYAMKIVSIEQNQETDHLISTQQPNITDRQSRRVSVLDRLTKTFNDNDDKKNHDKKNANSPLADRHAEQRIMALANNPYLIKLHYWFEDPKTESVCLVMDLVEGGELYHHLRRLGSFSEDLARFFICEIIIGLDYLHQQGVAYRDLKPENILLTAAGHVKITDFGLAKAGITSVGGAAEGSKTHTFCGTPAYLAPEVLRGEEHGQGVDWWTMGILLYEMLTGSV